MGARNSNRKIDKSRYEGRFKNRCKNRAKPELDAPIEPLSLDNLVDDGHLLKRKKKTYVPQLVVGTYKDQKLFYWDYSYIQNNRGDNVFGMELNGPEHDVYFRDKNND